MFGSQISELFEPMSKFSHYGLKVLVGDEQSYAFHKLEIALKASVPPCQVFSNEVIQ